MRLTPCVPGRQAGIALYIHIHIYIHTNHLSALQQSFAAMMDTRSAQASPRLPSDRVHLGDARFTLAAYTSAARRLPVGPTTSCEVRHPHRISNISTPKEKMSACAQLLCSQHNGMGKRISRCAGESLVAEAACSLKRHACSRPCVCGRHAEGRETSCKYTVWMPLHSK